MRKFLTRLFIFTCIVFALAWALDYTICKGLLRMEDYRFQDCKAMLDGSAKCDVLIMGNSRGKSHFDTKIIDSLCNVNSFCIGIGGYPIDAQLVKYHLFREHNGKPKTIIQNIDYITIKLIKDVRHQHQSEQFFPLIYDQDMRKLLKEIGYGPLELNIPLYRMFGYQMVIKNGILEALGIKHYISMPAYKGHRPEDGVWNGAALESMERQQIMLDEDAKRIFEQYLEQCQKDSIDVILVNSPWYSEAIKKLDGFYDATKYFEDISIKYEIPYLDYTNSCHISHSKDNFCVSVHMNAKATKEFTTLLCKDISPLLQ